jgi:putative membrane protein
VTLEAVADRRLHPATFAIRAIRSLPQYALGAPAIVGVTSDTGFAILLLVALGGLVAAIGTAWLFWKRFRYGVGANEIVIESGILHRQRRVIPFDRIQDIDIEQGPLARLFGTARVRIETGGAAKNEGSLDSVSLADARRLREVLRRGHAGAGTPIASALDDAGPTSAVADEPVLFSMSPRRVLLAGLFNFSLFYIAAIFGAAQYVEAIFGIDLWSLDWVDPARNLALRASWLVSLFAGVALVAIGVLAGISRTVARDWNFRLSRTDSGLRRRRGLFTLSEVVIPFRRIQLALIQSGPIARSFGWFRLEFQTLNADAAKAGHQVAAPLGRMEEILPILAQAHPAPPPPDAAFVHVSIRHILRQAMRWALLLALPVAAAAIAWPPALALLLLLPFIAGAAALQWKHHRYCLAPDALYIRQGWFTRRLWILPYERIQSISVTRGPLQRRLRLATIAADTAGASLFRSPHIVNLPAPDAARIAARLLAEHKRARDGLRLQRSP